MNSFKDLIGVPQVSLDDVIEDFNNSLSIISKYPETHNGLISEIEDESNRTKVFENMNKILKSLQELPAKTIRNVLVNLVKKDSDLVFLESFLLSRNQENLYEYEKLHHLKFGQTLEASQKEKLTYLKSIKPPEK